MPTTADYLSKLVEQKNTLADNLVTMGVSASHDETLETLVPKVLDISGGSGIYPIGDDGSPAGDVVIPEGVIQMGNSSYTPFKNNINVTSISCPSTLTSIPSSACNGASNLVSISGIENVTEIGTNAFYRCYNLMIDLPASLNTLGQSAFYGCSKINNINIPCITNWGTNVFKDCTALSTVSFAGDFSLSTIPTYTFNGCTSLKSITLPQIIDKIDTGAFCNSGIESIIVHNGVTYLANSVFYNCKSLVEISLPNTITYVNVNNGSTSNTFSSCTALTTVNLEQDFNCDISFYSSTNITNAAEMLTKLKDLTGEDAKTITFAKAVYDGLTADEIAVATNKNWTVASYGS